MNMKPKNSKVYLRNPKNIDTSFSQVLPFTWKLFNFKNNIQNFRVWHLTIHFMIIVFIIRLILIDFLCKWDSNLKSFIR